MPKYILKKTILVALIFAFISCQKAEIEKEKPSGTITIEIDGKRYSFDIIGHIGVNLTRGSGVFEAVSPANKEDVCLISLIDDWRDNNGTMRDFFDPAFRPDATMAQGMKISGEGFQVYQETTKITITKADFTSKTIEGTFSFTALGTLSKKDVKVENGYFKIKIPAWLYQ